MQMDGPKDKFKRGETPISALRRGFARCAETFFLGEFLDSVGIWHGLSRVIHANFAGFVLVVLACSCLWDLWDIVTRPDLSQIGEVPCNGESALLPFDDVK